MKRLVVVSASAIALVAAQGVLAQAQNGAAATTSTPAADAEQTGLADIVVTATRQSTNLQSTPIAISAITSQDLDTRNIKTTADLTKVVPNATFRKEQAAFGPGVSAYIRGIGQGDTSLGSEAGVAFYVDDVYYPLLLGSNFDLLDLDHVEVLRGPQGTLFGRNALAGAVNIVSKQPSFTELSGYAEVTTGAYHRIDVRAGMNVPIADNAALSISGLSEKRQGYQKILDFRCQMIKNGTPQLAGNFPFTSGLKTTLPVSANYSPSNCTIGHLGGQDVRAMRGSLRWDPLPNLKITLSGDYTRDNSENPADSMVGINPAVSNANVNLKAQGAYFTAPGGTPFVYDTRFLTGNPYTTYATYSDQIAAGTVLPGSTFYNGMTTRGGQTFDPHQHVTNWGVSGKIVYSVAPMLELTAIAGYRKVNTNYAFDIDASPIVVEHTLLNVGEDYKNVEVRASGKSSFIDYVAGLFYFHGNGFNHAFDYAVFNAVTKVQYTTYTPDSKAAYANVTIHPLPRLDITAGGRYSKDSKYVNFNNSADTGIGNIIFQVNPKASRFDWKAGIDYHLTNTTMIYANAATGARPPGFVARPLQPDQVGQFPGDETLAYEGGIKTDLFEHKLRINLTGFYTDYKTRITGVSGAEPLQIGNTNTYVPGSSVAIPLPAGGPGATQCRPQTAAEAAAGPGVQCIGRTYNVNTPGKVKGVEAEVSATPIHGLTLTGSMGYQRFTSPDLEAATRANDRLAGIPEMTASASIDYEIPAPFLHGTISPHLDWFYTGDITESASENLYNQPAYSTFNLRVSYRNEDHNFTISAGATNLFNKFYYQNFFVYQDIGYPNSEGQPAAPREWYLTISKKF